MKLLLSALLMNFAVTGVALASNSQPKTLACSAKTQDLSVKTEFSVVPTLYRDPKTGLGHYDYRSSTAFKTSDGRYTIGLSSIQPFNDPNVPHRRIGIWVKDATTSGATIQTGGISDSSDNEQDYASVSIINEKSDSFEILVECSLK